MYTISKEQKEALIKAFFDINAPVKLYQGVVEMLNSLPEIKDEKPAEVSKM